MIAEPQPKTRRIREAVTAAELAQLPDTERSELIRGELVEMAPPPGWDHGRSTNRIGARASVFVFDHDLGDVPAAETGFLLARDPDTVLAPDFAFVSKERIVPSDGKPYLPLCPDLVMETVSPSDTRREVALKTETWLRYGARMVWILDPVRRTLTIHRSDAPFRVLGPEDTLSGEDVLPGFSIALASVFPPS